MLIRFWPELYILAVLLMKKHPPKWSCASYRVLRQKTTTAAQISFIPGTCNFVVCPTDTFTTLSDTINPMHLNIPNNREKGGKDKN